MKIIFWECTETFSFIRRSVVWKIVCKVIWCLRYTYENLRQNCILKALAIKRSVVWNIVCKVIWSFKYTFVKWIAYWKQKVYLLLLRSVFYFLSVVYGIICVFFYKSVYDLKGFFHRPPYFVWCAFDLSAALVKMLKIARGSGTDMKCKQIFDLC